MRAPVDPSKVRRLLRELGRRARGPGRVYLAGGASALLLPSLVRYPALDAEAFEFRVRHFLESGDD